MFIIESFQFKFENYKYFPCDSLSITCQNSISCIALLLFDGFTHIRVRGTAKKIEKFKNKIEVGAMFEKIEFTIDYEHDLVYIHDTFYDTEKDDVTPEIFQLIEDDAAIELCHRNFIGYTTMSQENFYQLLLTWDKIVDDRAPFLLIYLDDKGWYDSLPFDTQEAMEKFVADHTQQEATQK